LLGVQRLKSALIGTIGAVARTVEKRDPYTAGHQQRVAELSVAIARELNLSEDSLEGLRLGATIHDIGKISVPAEILNRPGKISALEFELIKTHPQVGYDIVKDVEFPWPVTGMILQHHERLDGSGYPRGLKSEQIILEARIIAVADVVEAMSSHRPYRPGLGIETALTEIERGRGTQYDPDVTATCLRLFREKGYTLPE
jgi:putative nucleotidyltransferase with HDIG domain